MYHAISSSLKRWFVSYELWTLAFVCVINVGFDVVVFVALSISQEDANRGKPNWEHLSDELHVLITVEDTENRAHMKLERAVEEVKKLLVPVSIHQKCHSHFNIFILCSLSTLLFMIIMGFHSFHMIDSWDWQHWKSLSFVQHMQKLFKIVADSDLSFIFPLFFFLKIFSKPKVKMNLRKDS